MAAQASAYAALGLEPGADADAIDRAYRKLIKQYHPDRAGGDAKRAAEINRAYRELRSGRMPTALELADEADFVSAERNGWIHVGLLLAAAAALLLVLGPIMHLSGTSASSSLPEQARPRQHLGSSTDAMDRPLSLAAIDGSIRDAVRLSRAEDEMALAGSSRDCHRDLRSRPTLEQLDRCAAFDDAVIELQDRDPLRDRGPFSELAVTGRLMSGATMLSDDYLAIDGRLDRIRLRVEIALAPAPAPVIAPAQAEAGRDD